MIFFQFLFKKNNLLFINLFFLIIGCTSKTNREEATSNYLPSKWESTEIIHLCDSIYSDSEVIELIESNHGKQYFNKKIKRSKHEITVCFDFVTVCCAKYEIYQYIKKEVLYIEYTRKSGKICHCDCVYRATINLGDNERNFNHIKEISIKKM